MSVVENKAETPASGTQKKGLPDRPLLDWTTAEIDRVYRSLSDVEHAADLKVAWLADHTVEPVVRATAAYSRARDVTLATYIAPYDQCFQELLDENSGTSTSTPDLIVIWLSTRALEKSILDAANDGAGAAAGIDAAKREITDLVQLAQDRLSAHVFVCNFPRPAASKFGVADLTMPDGEFEIYSEMNRWLAEIFRNDPQISVIDIAHAVSNAGAAASWNPRMYHLAKIEWDRPATAYIADLLSRHVNAILRPARKCVVLDLDNTLWGGVVGEDGAGAIRIGGGDPVGEAYAAFQSALLDLKARGIVLAVCSKNNLADVEEAFEQRTDMPLRMEDFVASRINWDAKVNNIGSIAEELNIGTDSLVFIDDNPAEIELVRQLLPEVRSVLLPRDPSEYADILYSMCEFDKIGITSEDRAKTRQYKENTAREARRAETRDLASYLESLGTTVTVADASGEHLGRIHQLFSKTNQFNVTTLRHSLGDVQAFIERDDVTIRVAAVSDNYGDLGIIGVYVMQHHDDHAEITDFLMSCRALGRGVETAILNHLIDLAFQDQGISYLLARFNPTAKNKPAERFYDTHGFELSSVDTDGLKFYRLDRSQTEGLGTAPGIELVYKDNSQ